MGTLPRYDLKTPCKNCPFRRDETRIRFRGRERAEEIEEHAYRNGFPCHLSAELVEGEDGMDEYLMADGSQHCIGFIIMKILEGMESCWPGVGNDEDLVEEMAQKVNLNAPVFETTEEFLNANT